MSLRQSVQQLLKEVGTGYHITASAYDTAWVARLEQHDFLLSSQAQAWLCNHQLPDGSWGAATPFYYHDRFVCTLAAVVALAQSQRRSEYRQVLKDGVTALQRLLNDLPAGLAADAAGATVGFELVVPTLIVQARELGLIGNDPNPALDQLIHQRAQKLASLPRQMITRQVSAAFSAEMLGVDELAMLDVENLQEANGSVAYSPAATAFFILHCRPDPRSLQFLHSVMLDGAVPYTAPIDVFERAWMLWNLNLTQPDAELLSLCKPHLDALEQLWLPGRGIAAVGGLSLTDGDTTAMNYEVLASYGRRPDLEGLLHYKNGSHFYCFPFETNPSLSTNVHVLSVLKQAGRPLDDSLVSPILDFLKRERREGTFWFDKWHASPYYVTAHAIITCAGYCDTLVDNAVSWMLTNQQSDGSWGYYLPTAEETAYCLQALAVWKQHGHTVPIEALRRGHRWLLEAKAPPYMPLWLGKSLYCPTGVVQSAIWSALRLTT